MYSLIPTTDYAHYTTAWQRVADRGARDFNVDVWAAGRRYLSLAAICLSQLQITELRQLTFRFAPLVDFALRQILDDREWWSALAWPWPAIELCRQEPPHPGGPASLYGRFDCLLDSTGHWQIIEYNADTPSGGREAAGLEPAIARVHAGRTPSSRNIRQRIIETLRTRIAVHHRPVQTVGVVSSHSWIEDMAQAFWLATLLARSGQPTIVGDVTDVETHASHVTLRGQRIDALYRFYPVERLYRHAVFAPLWDAALDGNILLLNGLRGFLAQSKAVLAWLWMNRRTLDADARWLVEQHLPPTVLARAPEAEAMLSTSVVKHVNGREGDSVVFGNGLDRSAWESRLLEGGYVVQRAVNSPPVTDVEVDDWHEAVICRSDRIACVGAFTIGGRFGGCYTRLDGPITSSRATYAATLIERAVPRRSAARLNAPVGHG